MGNLDQLNQQPVVHKPQTNNSFEQSLSKPDMISSAVLFARNNENHFIQYCQRKKWDYENDYINAAIKYYQEYLKFMNK